MLYLGVEKSDCLKLYAKVCSLKMLQVLLGHLRVDRSVLGKTVLSVLLKTERRVFPNKDQSAGKQHIYLTSAQADMALYAGLRFPPFVEWFAETKTAGESL